MSGRGTPRRGSADSRLRLLYAAAALVALGLLMLMLMPSKVPPFVLSVAPWTAHEPWILLREQERLPDGLRVIELASTTDVQVGLQEGRVHAAAVALDEALRLRGLMPDLKVVAALSESRGADGVLLRRGLDANFVLVGHKVLVEDTASGRVMLAAALQALDLEIDQVRPVRVRGAQLLQLWNEGVADALVCYQPTLGYLQAQGHTLMLSTEQLAGLKFDVLAVRQRVLDARGESLASVLAAWDEGLRRLREADDVTLDLLRPGSDLDQAQYRQALDGLRFFDLDESLRLLEDPQGALRQAVPALGALLFPSQSEARKAALHLPMESQSLREMLGEASG
jgi:NitT/TauT family transport system substrate-binding protein